MPTVVERLAQLNLTLPAKAAAPAANYVPFVVSGKLVFVAGQIPMREGKVAWSGRLGAEVSLETGQEAARLCALNVIAQLREACGGDLERVRRVVKVGVFVACTPEFTDQPKVANGASDLLVAAFGEAGKHARAAVGCPSLPLGVPVEVDAVVELA
jgi:enamine deaminase RidA (YjgF/YER057c/UK114 family)